MVNNVTAELLTEVKEYLRLRKTELEITTVIKISKLLSMAVMLLAAIIFISIASILFVIAGILYIEPFTGSVWAFISGGIVYLLLWLILYIFRVSLVYNPIARFINLIIRL